AHEALMSRVAKGENVGIVRTAITAKDGRTIYLEGATTLYRAEGKPTALRSIYRDVTGIVTARQQVQEHEAKLKALFESSEHMFWTVDPGVRLTSFNKGYSDMIERLHGTRPELSRGAEEEKKKFASEGYHAFWDEKYREAFAGKPLRFETDLLDKRGDRVSNEVFLSPVFDNSGNVVEVFGVGHEITEQKVAEETVREQSARMKAIFESSANMMIWTLDKQLRITSCNEHFRSTIQRVHGIDFNIGDRFAEQMATRIAPDRAKELLANYHSALRGKPQQFEVELFDLTGRTSWVENFLNPIVINGEVREISCLAYGITDRKRAQRELVQSLSEKEVLLKEVHHRVKNNLQVINSIMKLQSARVENDPQLIEILHHSQDRVRSMALIHESLYQTKEFSYIDLGNYVDGLARNLVMSYSVNARVRLDLDLGEEQVLLVLDQASPCGLILNELISNALKHAFPGDRSGTVRVSMGLHEGRVRIGVADDGAGLPPDFDEERHGNLGLELVRMLVGQLDGSIERIDRGGVAYFLTFDRIKHS
ncbi:MAG TPA: PAS domain S-box protein, partial [Flavobacteriales bacterium]|nr:PAS domain S-box protein [Flavobacteriales bacterium]